MGGRRMLLVHHRQIMEEVINRFLQSEMPDVRVKRAEHLADASAALAEKRFDIIFCGRELLDGDGLRLADRLDELAPNRETPFVLLTPSADGAAQQETANARVATTLAVPFSARELAIAIDTFAPPHACRLHDRVSIPDLRVEIRDAAGEGWSGEAVNISEGGMLVDLAFRSDLSGFLGPVEAELRFPVSHGGGSARAAARFVRLEVLSLEPDESPAWVRTAWRFVEVDDAAAERLAAAIADGRSIPWPGDEQPMS